MNYSRAFSYVFEDKNWVSKILIAGLISLIPIIGQLYIFGWTIEIIRRVKAGRTDILPTTHFTYFLTLGLKMFVVSLIYSIPPVILSGILNLVTVTATETESGVISFTLTSVGCLGSLVTLVVSFAMALLTTYGMIKLAETDQIKACLDFKDAFNCIKTNIGLFIIVELLGIVAQLISAAGSIICVIGLIFTIPYGSAIIAHLVGQLWENLKPYDKSARPFRGAAAPTVEDTIEEAPFTKVEDIEKTVVEEAHETVEEAAEKVQDAAEPVTDAVETAAESAASVIEEAGQTAEAVSEEVEQTAETVSENVQTAVEEAADEVKEAAEEVSEEVKDKSDDDLPSFE